MSEINLPQCPKGCEDDDYQVRWDHDAGGWVCGECLGIFTNQEVMTGKVSEDRVWKNLLSDGEHKVKVVRAFRGEEMNERFQYRCSCGKKGSYLPSLAQAICMGATHREVMKGTDGAQIYGHN